MNPFPGSETQSSRQTDGGREGLGADEPSRGDDPSNHESRPRLDSPAPGVDHGDHGTGDAAAAEDPSNQTNRPDLSAPNGELPADPSHTPYDRPQPLTVPSLAPVQDLSGNHNPPARTPLDEARDRNEKEQREWNEKRSREG